MVQTLKDIVQRITEQLPDLDPSSVRNTTPGRQYQLELRDTDGVIDTIVISGEETSMWIGFNLNGRIVTEVRDATPIETLQKYRREDRADVFADTVDRMNPVWYNSLTIEQQTELSTWRQAWLDYPATGTRPIDLEIFN